MVCGEQTHIDPKSYYDPNSPRPQKSLMGEYWYTGAFTAAGVLTGPLHNYMKHQPLFAGNNFSLEFFTLDCTHMHLPNFILHIPCLYINIEFCHTYCYN